MFSCTQTQRILNITAEINILDYLLYDNNFLGRHFLNIVSPVKSGNITLEALGHIHFPA